MLALFFMQLYNPILNNLGIVYYVFIEIAVTFKEC
jgi:hypothetical protein